MYNNGMGVIEDKCRLLPDNPGVYVMLDKNGTVIYVGKAKNLKNRVRQYFYSSVKTDKVAAMVASVNDFYYIIAPSEIDALSLENNLIKKYKPRYNILLKDDKTYPYIKINPKEVFPYLKVTRKIKKDGAKYFGPYMGGVRVYDVLDMTNMLFGLRSCDKKINTLKHEKPCLNYHINKCAAPCAGLVDKGVYAENVRRAVEFLSGDVTYAEKILTERMKQAATEERFEAAIKYKEYLEGLDKIKLKRITSLNRFLSADVIACADNGIYSAINLLVVRGGRMLGGKNFSFESAALNKSEAISEFINRYYTGVKDVPNEIISETEIGDAAALEDYIRQSTGVSAIIVSPKAGVRKSLADMAAVNAEEHLSVAIDRIKHKDDMTVSACKKLREVLGLKNYPKRAECYDISHISGTDKVGSMVVFTDGEADKNEYRRFKIKTIEGSDDFACLQEVLRRRLERLNTDPEKFSKPDLVIIDGGKGQLSSVKEIFDEFKITDIDLISLAKREEEVFLPQKSQPVVLDKSDYVLKMLQRIRDEAHRFAITFHRTLRGKRSLSSVLDEIKGLGKVKKHALLEKFKDLGGIISAEKSDLVLVEGIGDKQADAIIEKLTEKGLK